MDTCTEYTQVSIYDLPRELFPQLLITPACAETFRATCRRFRELIPERLFRVEGETVTSGVYSAEIPMDINLYPVRWSGECILIHDIVNAPPRAIYVPPQGTTDHNREFRVATVSPDQIAWVRVVVRDIGGAVYQHRFTQHPARVFRDDAITYRYFRPDEDYLLVRRMPDNNFWQTKFMMFVSECDLKTALRLSATPVNVYRRMD